MPSFLNILCYAKLAFSLDFTFTHSGHGFLTQRAHRCVFPTKEPLPQDEIYHVPRKQKEQQQLLYKWPFSFSAGLSTPASHLDHEFLEGRNLSHSSFISSIIGAYMHTMSRLQGTQHLKSRDPNFFSSVPPSMPGTAGLPQGTLVNICQIELVW